MRRCIFARVKFLSRVVHCLEFAAIDRNAGSSEQSHAAQSATNRAQTRRIARVVFVEELNLAELEFSGVDPEATDRPFVSFIGAVKALYLRLSQSGLVEPTARA
jgi:hypothetical protein